MSNNNDDGIEIDVIVTRCPKCQYDEFDEIEKMSTPMLKCMNCLYEMVDEFKVYGGFNNKNE